jgi:hypothetical protein
LVDAYTSSSVRQLLIRQYVTSDIISSGGGGINWKGVYNESSSYAVNDWVFIDPNRIPPYPNLAPTSASAPFTYGEFICKVSVPAYNSSSLNGGRNTGSYWYPTYPLPPSSSQVIISGSTYNQIYWDAVSPMFASQFCVNGSTQTVLINGVISGSVFNSKPAYP